MYSRDIGISTPQSLPRFCHQPNAFFKPGALAAGYHRAQAVPQLRLLKLSEIAIGFPLKSEPSRKDQIDVLLLKLPGVSGRKINGLDGYFVSDKMFACVSGNGIGLRLPVATATELQFSRDNVVPFQPGGMSSTREWIQINRAEATEYEKDLELFHASLDFVRSGRR